MQRVFFFNENKQLYFSINSGAVELGKKYHCTPLQSLDYKEFSTGYWQRYYGFLLDAVRQFGYPFLLITISPSEWSFPQACFHLTYVLLLGIFHHHETIRLQKCTFVPSYPYVKDILEIIDLYSFSGFGLISPSIITCIISKMTRFATGMIWYETNHYDKSISLWLLKRYLIDRY